MSQDLIDRVKAALDGATPGKIGVDVDGFGGHRLFACGFDTYDGSVILANVRQPEQISFAAAKANAQLYSLAPDMARALLAMEAERKAAEKLAAAVSAYSTGEPQSEEDGPGSLYRMEEALAAYRKAREAAE